MDIKDAKYEKGGNTEANYIVVTLSSGGVLVVPLADDNSDYVEVMRQVADKDINLKIKEAD